MKTCRHCGEKKKNGEFYKRTGTPDGLHYNCKTCCKVINQASYIKKKESRTNYNRQRYANETAKPVKKVKRRRNASGQRKYTPQHAQRARDLNLAADPTISLHEVYKRDKGICQICKDRVATRDASIDHVVPISKGGTHTWDNVQLAHRTCNYRKGAKLK